MDEIKYKNTNKKKIENDRFVKKGFQQETFHLWTCW